MLCLRTGMEWSGSCSSWRGGEVGSGALVKWRWKGRQRREECLGGIGGKADHRHTAASGHTRNKHAPARAHTPQACTRAMPTAPLPTAVTAPTCDTSNEHKREPVTAATALSAHAMQRLSAYKQHATRCVAMVCASQLLPSGPSP